MASWRVSNLRQDEEEEEEEEEESENDDDEHIDLNKSFSSQRLMIEEAEEEDDACIEEEDDEVEDEEEEEDETEDLPFNTKDSTEFSIALQELQSIRSHLYAAADYCESAYVDSDQKQAIFENLKDYSVKALVNAVDHIGTVAAKLNDLLSKRTKEISVVEFNVSCLSQRFQACHDRAKCEGLNHYQYAKRRPRYGQHYALAEVLAGDSSKQEDQRWIIVKKISQAENIIQHQVDSVSDLNEPKSLSWHLSETRLVSASRSTPTAPHVNRSTSSNFRVDRKAQGFLSRSLSGGQFSLPRTLPNSITSKQLIHPPGASKSLSSLLSLDETKRHGQRIPKKSLLTSFLGRTKSGKPKRLSTLTSFK